MKQYLSDTTRKTSTQTYDMRSSIQTDILKPIIPRQWLNHNMRQQYQIINMLTNRISLLNDSIKDCSISSVFANALEIPQSCIKPLKPTVNKSTTYCINKELWYLCSFPGACLPFNDEHLVFTYRLYQIFPEGPHRQAATGLLDGELFTISSGQHWLFILEQASSTIWY